MTQPVTVTISVPTPYAVDPARLVAWITEHGWVHDTEFVDDSGSWYTRDCHTVWLPRREVGSSYQRDLSGAIQTFANIEGVRPCALAAQLVSPTPSAALQWEHMSTTARAATVEAISALARQSRTEAATWRAVGNVESALAAEGRALGLEAAVAVLQGAAGGGQ